jgi:hypothetical protein
MISANFTTDDTMLSKYPTIHYSASDWWFVALLTVGTMVLVAPLLVAAYLIYQTATVEVSEPSVISSTWWEMAPSSSEGGEFTSVARTLGLSDAISDTIDAGRALEISSGDEEDRNGSSNDGDGPVV